MGTVFHPPQPATRATDGCLSMPWSGAEFLLLKPTVSFPGLAPPELVTSWKEHDRHCFDASLHYVQTYQNELMQGTRLETNTLLILVCVKKRQTVDTYQIQYRFFRKRRDLPTWIQCSFEVLTRDRDYIWHKLHKLHKPIETALKNQNQGAAYVEDAWVLCIPMFRVWKTKNPSIKLGIPAHQAQGQALVAFASPAIQFNILVTFFNIFNPSKMRHFQTIFRCNGYYSYILILNTYFHVTWLP